MATHGSKMRAERLAGDQARPVSMKTLADVLRRLEADDGLDQRQLREMRSAVNAVCRTLGTQPDLVPAEPRQLRPKLAKLTPAIAGVSPGRWCNIKSLTLKALKRAGLKSMAGRSRDALAPDWEALRALIPDRHFQSGLCRLMSFCTERGVSPAAVTAETFAQFGLEVENYSLVRDPGGLYRDTCKLWNRAVRTIPGWPQLKVAVPDRRRTFALTLDDFPSPFRMEVEGFLTRCAEPDVFSDSYCKPAAELTLRNRRGYILMAATALVHTGVPISQVTGLDVIVDIDHAKALLRFLYNRAGDKTNNQIYHIGTLLKTISRHYLHQPEETVAQLRNLCKKLKPENEGFTEKNRQCLRQFADLKKLANLLLLPQRVIEQVARRHQIRRRDAVRVEFAIAVGVLLNIPVRADNLAGLRLDQHLRFVGDRTFLSVPSDETKNAIRIEAELTARLVRLLQTYVEEFRHLLVGTPVPWLFPGKKGARRPSGGFGQQLTRFLAKEAGVVMTPHQFRHLAAKLFLDRHPDGFETVRRLLGHKSIETTMRYYRELESVLAGKRYAALLDELLADHNAASRRPVV
jgi:integrase